MTAHTQRMAQKLRKLASECGCRAEHGAEPKAFLRALSYSIMSLATLAETIEDTFDKEEKRFSSKHKTRNEIEDGEAAKEPEPPF